MPPEQAVKVRRLRSACKLALELGGERREPEDTAVRRISLQGVAHGAVEVAFFQSVRSPCRENVDLTLSDAVALPDHVAEHNQDHCRNTRQEPRRAPLAAGRRFLRAAHVRKLLVFLARARGLSFLPGIEEGTLQVCDLRCVGLARSDP